jgi:hypothetical protein
VGGGPGEKILSAIWDVVDKNCDCSCESGIVRDAVWIRV